LFPRLEAVYRSRTKSDLDPEQVRAMFWVSMMYRSRTKSDLDPEQVRAMFWVSMMYGHFYDAQHPDVCLCTDV
jgi:hypothetical protein